MEFLVASLVLSIVLTIVANVALRLAPPRRSGRRSGRPWDLPPTPPAGEPGRRGSIRVFFPWKTMLVASVVLTVLVNVIARL